MRSTTAERLAQAIRASGVPPARIAAAAKVSRSQLSRLLSGERGLSLESAERVAAALGLEVVLRRSPRRKG